MESEETKKVYSTETIDFIKTANDFCKLAGNITGFKRSELLRKLQQILPLLYFRALNLPSVESLLDEGNEKFVTEDEYEALRAGLELKFGYLDEYPEVIDPEDYYDTPVTSLLSEDMADIYQELKDFLTLFQVGTEEMMNDAIWETKMNFSNYWGQKLVNALRVIHKALNDKEPVNDEEITGTSGNKQTRDTSSWFVTKRQEDLRKEDF